MLSLSSSGCASKGKPAGTLAKGPLPYSGPKAKITVTAFSLKAAKVSSDVGAGLREMLVNALANTNRFLLLEAESAELIISATVNEFEPQASGGSSGVGAGGGGGSGIFGGLLGNSLSKAHLALEMRIIDVSTSAVLSVASRQGRAAEMDKAISICINETARYIVQNIPTSFYKY